MYISLPERLAMVALSVLLLIGATILHYRHFRPVELVTVEHDGIKREMSLGEASAMMRERAKVNVNKADERGLLTIPGIGRGLAAEISAFRNNGGVFTVEEDLLKVHGIGPRKLEKMKGYVKYED